jgi:hypothetical protein
MIADVDYLYVKNSIVCFSFLFKIYINEILFCLSHHVEHNDKNRI